jgi:hypothetical protein
MIKCVGRKNGKYLIRESDRHIRLVFSPRCKKYFVQENTPKKPIEDVKFDLSVRHLNEEFPGFLPRS